MSSIQGWCDGWSDLNRTMTAKNPNSICRNSSISLFYRYLLLLNIYLYSEREVVSSAQFVMECCVGGICGLCTDSTEFSWHAILYRFALFHVCSEKSSATYTQGRKSVTKCWSTIFSIVHCVGGRRMGTTEEFVRQLNYIRKPQRKFSKNSPS